MQEYTRRTDCQRRSLASSTALCCPALARLNARLCEGFIACPVESSPLKTGKRAVTCRCVQSRAPYFSHFDLTLAAWLSQQTPQRAGRGIYAEASMGCILSHPLHCR